MREKIYIIYHFYDHFPRTVQYMHKVNSNYGLFSTHRRDSFDCRSFELVQFLCSALTGESRGCNSLESEVGSSSRQSVNRRWRQLRPHQRRKQQAPAYTAHYILAVCLRGSRKLLETMSGWAQQGELPMPYNKLRGKSFNISDALLTV